MCAVVRLFRHALATRRSAVAQAREKAAPDALRRKDGLPPPRGPGVARPAACEQTPRTLFLPPAGGTPLGTARLSAPQEAQAALKIAYSRGGFFGLSRRSRERPCPRLHKQCSVPAPRLCLHDCGCVPDGVRARRATKLPRQPCPGRGGGGRAVLLGLRLCEPASLLPQGRWSTSGHETTGDARFGAQAKRLLPAVARHGGANRGPLQRGHPPRLSVHAVLEDGGDGKRRPPRPPDAPRLCSYRRRQQRYTSGLLVRRPPRCRERAGLVHGGNAP
jgi:hypothetical protein